MPKGPEVSIIIRTKNEARHIQKTLERIFKQRHDSYEVIVVDSGSTDETIGIVKNFPVRLVNLDPGDFTYGRALNVGIKKSLGRYFISLSAHAMPLDRDWLRNIIAPFSDPTVAGVAGKALPHPDCNPFDQRGLMKLFGTEKKYLHRESDITFSNANSAVRREVWNDNPFDENLPYSEDIKWSWEMMRMGWRFVYEPAAAVFHSHNEQPAQLFDRFYNESRARTLLGYADGRFSARRLIYDSTAGTLYDLVTSLMRPKSSYWSRFAPVRRFWINIGRYFGSRNIRKGSHQQALMLLLLRVRLLFVAKINSLLERMAPFLVSMTHRDIGAMHPRLLLDRMPGEFWYDDEVRDAEMVLEIGCGQGEHILHAADLAKRVYGIDTDRRGLYISNFMARWEDKENLALLASNTHHVPFPDGVFDRVLAFDVLSNEHNRKPLLDEMARVLKPGGRLLCSVSKSDTPRKLLWTKVGLHDGRSPSQVIEFTQEEMVGEMAGSGFSFVASHPVLLDTPFYAFFDVIGGVSLFAYRKIFRWMRAQALAFPEKSGALRMVFQKSVSE